MQQLEVDPELPMAIEAISALPTGPPRSKKLVVVQLQAVRRTFGSVPALTGATIDAPAGSITVLLGPNGAGKTTTIRVITGVLEPDEGTVGVFGLDPAGPEGEHVRRRCGVVTAKPSLYDRLSGMDNLRYAAELFGLGRGTAVDDRVMAAADRFGIASSLDQEVGAYSTGMKTRLALARAVLHEPDLLLLDEPTSGLDPESASAVLELIRDMTSDGRTVLLCTHLLAEAEGLADRIVVMEAGSTVVAGDPVDLCRRYWPNPSVRLTAERGATLDRLANQPGVIHYERKGDVATILIDHDNRTADLVDMACRGGVRLLAVEPHRPSLEDLYFAIRSPGLPPPPTGRPEPMPNRSLVPGDPTPAAVTTRRGE